MSDIISHIATVFMGLFAIMNPIANTPVFIGLTAEDDPVAKKTIAFKSTFLAFVIVTAFCLSGKLIFQIFGITLPAFRITGGLLVFLVGFHMLHGNQSPVHNPSKEDNQKSVEADLSVAISPLAIPILAGPGTIVAAMNFATGKGIVSMGITLSSFALLCAITYVFFVFGQKLVKYIGESALKVITRLMGLILAIIGVQMLIEGISGSIKMFK
jgi:multiple antibiotic resistance protein